MQGPQHGAQGTTPTRWRVFCETGHTQGYIALASVAFRSSPGGEDEALKDNSIGNTNKNSSAFDQGTLYVYITSPTGMEIGYVFPEVVNIKEFVLEKYTGMFPSWMPKDFRLQYSDNGTDWTDGEVVTGVDDWLDNNEIKEFEVTDPDSNGNHQYWRLYVDVNNSNPDTYLGELQLRGTVGGETLTSIGSASASSVGNGAAAFAFDDAPTSTWGSTTDIDEWIEFDFIFPTAVVEVALESHSGFYYTTAYPEDFRLEYYDGSEWTSALRVTGASSTSKNQIQVYTV